MTLPKRARVESQNKPNTKSKHTHHHQVHHRFYAGDHLNNLWKNLSIGFSLLKAINARIFKAVAERIWTQPVNECDNGRQVVLPEDIEVEILARLPVQSLVRLRCVSKSWCAIIKTPTFINRHLRQQKKGSVLLIRRHKKDKDILSFHDPDSPDLDKLHPNLSIPFLKDIKSSFLGVRTSEYIPSEVYVWGPFNGLVCISHHHERFILCNPALREFKLLPACPYVSPPAGYGQGFGARGFGLSSNLDFKAVLIRSRSYVDGSPYVLAYVYNLRTNTWSEVDWDPTLPANYDIYLPCSQVFLNGVCHWYTCPYNIMEPDHGVHNFILSFDLNSEVFGRLKLPDPLKPSGGFGHRLLRKLNGCLAAVREYYKDRVEVWVMREYGVEESWTKQVVIPQYDDLNIQPFLLWKNGERLLYAMNNGQLACLASDPAQHKVFNIYGDAYTFQALLCEESLISVHKLDTLLT